MTTTIPQVIRTREDLVSALDEAAELEHGLMCQYLFAAFSMKKAGEPASPYAAPLTPAQYEITRRWQATILKVARQEMEHLALVNNLRIGIGAPPYFWRPNFPVQYGYDPFELPFMLERFDDRSLDRFIHFERPEVWSPGDCGPDPEIIGQRAAARYSNLAVPLRAARAEPPYPRIDSIQQLYDAVQDAVNNVHRFDALDNLFVDGAERRKHEPFENFLFVQEANIFAFQVYDRRTANAAIDEIMREGEGVDAQPGYSSHYCSFSWIYDGLKAGGFDAAWNVISNPSPDNVSDPVAQSAVALFDYAYVTMLSMVTSFYTYFTPEVERPPGSGTLVPGDPPYGKLSAALQDCAFAPMMTMVLRPLGEILTRLPAGDGEHTAGPAWSIPDDDRPLAPQDDPRFFLNRFTTIVESLGRLAAEAPAEVAPRLDYIWQSVSRMQANFKRTAVD
jgi:hypothetical protein